MKYNPDQHHRRSIRLKGYDYTSAGLYFITICTHQRQCLLSEIVDGEMQLNALGQMVQACWQRLPSHFPHLTLDAFIVMPNHVHGILVLPQPSGRGAALDQDLTNRTTNTQPNATPSPSPIPDRRGAALDQDLTHLTDDFNSNATPNPDPSEPGVAFGQDMVDKTKEQWPNAAPLQARSVAGSVGSIVLNFKSVTTRSKNRMQRSPGVSLWQRNYYEHIVRNEAALDHLRQYIHNNPGSWQKDQLHPKNPSKG